MPETTGATANGSVLDQFTFQAYPGPVMLARGGHDVRFTNLLLRANGNRSSWSYNWSVNWGYTFWRSSAPVHALGAREPAGAGVLDEEQGLNETVQTIEGADSGRDASPEAAPGEETMPMDAVDPAGGDRITVDRANKAITIVVR